MTPSIDYNAIASIYALNRSASPAVLGRILADMVSYPHQHILEAGCGTADYLYALSQAWHVTGQGFDRSEGMIEQARQKNPGLELQPGDGSARFSYPDLAYDLVYSVDVIHYIPDLVHFFSEVRRLLKPNGLALTVTDSTEDIRGRTMAYYFPEIVAVELERYPTIERIQQAMQIAGFGRTWTTHTERPVQFSSGLLERYRNKAYSSLRLIDEQAYQAGLARLEKDFQSGEARARELYTLVWGEKAREN
jgi:SAM-dependent methyltransferase